MVSSEHSSNKDKIKQQQKKTKEKKLIFYLIRFAVWVCISLQKKNNFQKQTNMKPINKAKPSGLLTRGP